MTALRAVLDANTNTRVHRRTPRRKLRLQAQGRAGSSDTADVLILDISRTGLLLRTAGDLTEGVTIEFELPDATVVHAVVRWSSGDLFGCEFNDAISSSTLSAALLRAPFEAAPLPEAFASADISKFQNSPREVRHERELSNAVKMRVIMGLALLSWAVLAAALSIAWGYFH